MTIPVVRVYEKAKQAQDAVAELKQGGFADDLVLLLTPGLEGVDDSTETISKAITIGSSLGDDAELCAESLRQGRSVVVALAPFGRGLPTAKILDSHKPIPTEVERAKRPTARDGAAEWERGAPLSSAFGLPILSRNDPAPLSDALWIKTLSKGRSFESMRPLTRPDWTFSSSFGMKLLSHDPAPLSKLLGIKTLSSKKQSWTRSFGIPMLSSNAAPLSSLLGIPLLSTKAAPFSSMLGLRLLSRRR